MSILCCRRSDPSTVNKQATLPPKILDRTTAPCPPASYQNIESFQNEGRKLPGTQQEETDKASLQDEIKEEPRNPRTFIDGEEVSTRHIVAEHRIGTHRPSKSSSATELRGSIVSTVSDSSYITVPAKSMPALTDTLVPGIVESAESVQDRNPNYVAPISIFCEEAGAAPVSQTLLGNSLMVPGVAIPSTPGLSPYLMPSITTTIASINGGSRSGNIIPILEGNAEIGKSLPEQIADRVDIGVEKQQEDCDTVRPETRLDGTTADEEEAITMDTGNSENAKYQGGAGTDLAGSRTDFTPNEIFSKIPTWVRPSTSTFMSLPSTYSRNRKDGLESPPSTGSATPELAKSNSTRFYSPLEATSASNTGVNTPAFACPPTPGYEFRPSIDNTSSFYPSPGTSNCVSLAGSERRISESSDLFADTDSRILNRTPRPSDIITASSGGSSFKFPWANRSRNKSPEPISNEDAFTRGSSLAHLKKAQKKGCELPKRHGANSKPSRSRDTVADQYNEICEDTYLKEDRAISSLVTAPSHSKTLIGKGDLYHGKFENREDSSGGITPASQKKERTTTWVRSTTRVSSLTMRQDKIKDPRILGSPRTRSFRGNTFRNYGKSEKKFSLKNSISLGERMWEHSSIRGKGQEGLQKPPGSDVLSSLTSDIETLYETDERSSRLKTKRSRAVIRSRSMTLRRTFTNSIAKLRARVSFNGSSKGVIPPLPRSNQSNNDDLYQGRYNEGNIGVQNSEILGEVSKFDMSESDASSIVFRPTLPKEMLEHHSNTEIDNDMFSEGRDITAEEKNAQICVEPPSDKDMNSHQTPDSRSISGKSGSLVGIEESTVSPRPWSTMYDDCVILPFDNSGDDESDNGVDAQSTRLFETGDKNEKEIWRDARESLEITV